MTVRIADLPRTVTWTESSTVRIGFSTCGGCGIETPEPPDSALIEFAREGGGGRTLWPADAGFSSRWMWMPSGWSQELVTKADGGVALLCPICTRVVREAISAALRRNSAATPRDEGV